MNEFVLPDHVKLVTEEFREGWDFVQSGNVHWTKNPKGGWHSIRITDMQLIPSEDNSSVAARRTRFT